MPRKWALPGRAIHAQQMAHLLIKSPGFGGESFELHLGSNTLGRSPENDWQINHPTVSGRHCEIQINLGGGKIKDCGSTNGTFLNGQRVEEAALSEGQILRMGDVELVIENVEVKVAIPRFDTPMPAPPVMLPTGGMLCPNHAEAIAAYQCTHCRLVMCETCVHHLRRRGGEMLLLCPVCSHPVETLIKQPKKKKTFVEYLRMTVKMPLVRRRNRRRRRI